MAVRNKGQSKRVTPKYNVKKPCKRCGKPFTDGHLKIAKERENKAKTVIYRNVLHGCVDLSK